MKNEIEYWLDSKTLEFAQEESTRTWLSAKKWIDKYIYSDIHKIFFVGFPILLHEWLSILATKQTNFERRETVEWSDQLVREVTSVSNTISRAIDFWVDRILQGYNTEFAVDTITSYSEAEIFFSKDHEEDTCYVLVHG